jgi:hypothetical protein
MTLFRKAQPHSFDAAIAEIETLIAKFAKSFGAEATNQANGDTARLAKLVRKARERLASDIGKVPASEIARREAELNRLESQLLR